MVSLPSFLPALFGPAYPNQGAGGGRPAPPIRSNYAGQITVTEKSRFTATPSLCAVRTVNWLPSNALTST